MGRTACLLSSKLDHLICLDFLCRKETEETETRATLLCYVVSVEI